MDEAADFGRDNGGIISASSFAKMQTVYQSAVNYGLGMELPNLGGEEYFGHDGEVGNTSGLYYCNISTDCAPNGYYLSYNINYAIEVDFFDDIDERVQDLFQGCLASTDEVSRIDFSVSPNPAKNELNLQLNNSTNSNYEIFNLNGQLVLNGQLNSGNTKLSVSSLSTGTYLLKVLSEEGVGVKRIVVA